MEVDAARDLAEELKRAIAKRGPDGEGVAFAASRRIGFVHTRLAIIDPNPRSNQPFMDAASGAMIVFNGEIYNYRALREGLAANGVGFSTSSDTEVVLKGYLKEGIQFFRKLRGMYALAIYDSRTGEVVVLRDPFGIKPIYARSDPQGVLFGSSARGLARVMTRPDLDPAAAVSFAVLGCVLEPLTCFRGIRMLEPGSAHIWRIVGDAVTEARMPIAPDFPMTSDLRQPLSALEQALTESVTAHFEADVEVAVFQSGGLDSTIISSLAKATGMNPTLITLGFEEFRGTPIDEVPRATEIAQHLQLRHSAVYLQRADFEGLRERFLADMESPTVDAINTYLVARACRQLGIKVALSGVGGDELFGGYPSFRILPAIYRLRNLLNTVPVKYLVEVFMGVISNRSANSPKLKYLTKYLSTFQQLYLFQRAVYLPRQASVMLDPEVVRAGMEGFLAAFDHWTRGGEGGSLADVRQFERDVYMRNMLLRDADWAGMAHGVEIRTPFIDAALHRAICDEKNRCGFDKHDLRRILAKADPRLGAYRGRKMGFSVPYQAWFHGASPAEGARSSARGILDWSRQILNANFPGWAMPAG